MKKTMMMIVSLLAGVTAVGSATVTAHATEELTVTTMSELVSNLKTMDHFGSTTYQLGDFIVTYSWDIESKEKMEEWYNHLSVKEAKMLEDKYKVTPEFIVDHYSNWHLVSAMEYNPFYMTVL